ncbi:MAG: hypothetical protein A2089_12620 [Elusimicrobia bacterium GWD2_63_28]|nr:MAG: hypothetical protein A2089_12620 [Elusimicrobia bacterium GWD2_63_28]
MTKKKDLKITALVTARGRNTFKNKHLRPVSGHPLIWYPLRAVRAVKEIGRFYISSDSRPILKLGKALGFQPITRPPELALPRSQHADSLYHALEVMKSKDGHDPEILVVALGNTVCFRPEWISKSIKLLLANPAASAVVPVYQENDHHPYRAKFPGSDGFLRSYFDFRDKRVSTNRQDLPPNYFLCHNFWTLRLSKSLYARGGQQPWAFMGEKVLPLVVEEGPDVHEESDIYRSERWLLKS